MFFYYFKLFNKKRGVDKIAIIMENPIYKHWVTSPEKVILLC